MKRFTAYLLLALTLLCSLPSLAGDGLFPKQNITGAPGSCHAVSAADELGLKWGPLYVLNTSPVSSHVVCSPAINSRGGGTIAFGAKLANMTPLAINIACVGYLANGAGASMTIPRTTTVPGNKPSGVHVQWAATEMNGSKVLLGQSGFLCTLPPGTGITWTWTQDQSN